MVYILLGAGFETAEALVAANILRRGGVAVKLAGIGGPTVASSHNIVVTADCPVESVTLSAGDMVVLPGGMGGVSSIAACPAAMALAEQAAKSDELWLAAICAAPAMLAEAGVLPAGKKAVCYPGMEGALTAAGLVPCMGLHAVRDGKLITGRAPGSACEFGFALLEALAGADTARSVREQMWV